MVMSPLLASIRLSQVTTTPASKTLGKAKTTRLHHNQVHHSPTGTVRLATNTWGMVPLYLLPLLLPGVNGRFSAEAVTPVPLIIRAALVPLSRWGSLFDRCD